MRGVRTNRPQAEHFNRRAALGKRAAVVALMLVWSTVGAGDAFASTGSAAFSSLEISCGDDPGCPNGVVADSTDSATVTLIARDSAGQATTGDDVEFAYTSPGFVHDDDVDHGDGTYTAEFSSSVLGTMEIYALINGEWVDESVSVTFVVGPPSSVTTTISAAPNSIPADGVSRSRITVQLKGRGGHDATSNGDEQVVLTADSDAGATLLPAVEQSNGTWEAILVSGTRPGRTAVTGTLDGSMIASSAEVTHVEEGGTVSRPPSLPVLLSPSAGGVFAPGARQDFTIRATDPDGDPYWGELAARGMFENVPTPYPMSTVLAPSGMRSSTVGPSTSGPLPPGTYSMSAFARDVWGVRGPGAEWVFGVAAAGPSPCSDGTDVVDGWFQDAYLKLSHNVINDVGYICVRTAKGTDSLAGWLRAESGGPSEAGDPTTGTTSACPDRGDDNLPFPLYEVGTGDRDNPREQLQLFLRRTGTTVTACVKVKAAGGDLVDTSITIEAPAGAKLSDLNFVPEVPGAWTAPAPLAPPAGLPSSACFTAGGQRVVNAAIKGQQLWLYANQGVRSQVVCARFGSDIQRGARVRIPNGDGQAPLYSVQAGSGPDDEESPCPVPVLIADDPVSYRMRHTGLNGPAAGVCVFLGHQAAPGARLAVDLLAPRSPGSTQPDVTLDEGT